MSAPTPRKEQDGGVLADVKATPYGRPTASLDTGRGHHPQTTIRGAAEKKITTNQVPTESGEPRGGLKSPPAGRLRRANNPSSPAQHHLKKLAYHTPFSVRDTRGSRLS
jgi:hypothetical protein